MAHTSGSNRVVSRQNALPDLRFLNHNKQPLKIQSILAPASVNSQGVQMFTALGDAEAWFSGTALVLKDRLMLCEDLRDALKEMNVLLVKVESLVKKTPSEDGASGSLKEQVGVVASSGDGPGVHGLAKGAWEKDAGPAIDRNDSLSKSEVVVAETEIISTGDKNHPTEAGADMKQTENDLSDNDQLKALEAAAETWLREIRVLRAKWIAGGRNIDKMVGLRR